MKRLKILIIFLLLIILMYPFQYLILENEDQILEVVSIKKIFSIQFKHSVNKGIIIEKYKVNSDNTFYLDEGYFQSFGAGMMDSLEKGVEMSKKDDFLVLKFPIKNRKYVYYSAAGFAKQHLITHNRNIDLFKISPYKRIKFYVKKLNLIQVFLYKLNI